MMFDHLIEDSGLKEVFEHYGLTARDLIFIKEQIAGPLTMTASDVRKIFFQIINS